LEASARQDHRFTSLGGRFTSPHRKASRFALVNAQASEALQAIVMVSFKPGKKLRGDTMSLLRPGGRASGLFQKRGSGGGGRGGTLLRSDDDEEDGSCEYGPIKARSLFVGGNASTPPPSGKRDPPASSSATTKKDRSDVTPPLSPESDDDDDLEGGGFGPAASYLQFEAPYDPPGHKKTRTTTTIGAGDNTASLVQNLLCMMDKACVAPTEGDWGSNASNAEGGGGGPASSSSSDGEEEEVLLEMDGAAWLGGGRTKSEAEAASNGSSKVQYNLEPQKGEKHESFEMILREMTPPRKKKLGIKSLLHSLPALPIRSGAAAAEQSTAAARAANSKAETARASRSRSASPNLGGSSGNLSKRKDEPQLQRHNHYRHRDNEGRLHKPLTAVSDLIPIEEEKKDDSSSNNNERYLQPPRSKPRSSTVPTAAPVHKPINPPPITRNLAKEARYKQVLGTWMMSRTPLETITEDDHHRAAHEDATTAVRVPGIRNPDVFLSHSDMIGDIVQGRTPDSSPAKAADNKSKAASATTTDNNNIIPPEPTAPIKKSRTWMGKWLGGLGLDEEEDDEDVVLPRALSRQRSAPGNLTPESSGLDSAAKKAASAAQSQRLWKATVCHETGRTYYYHRVTRRTTWTKPPDDELIVQPSAPALPSSSSSSGPNGGAEEEEDIIKQVLLPTFSKDTEEVLAAKREIAAILHEMGQDTHSVDKILAQYDGREREFLDRLRTASEDQPFDELIGRSGHDGASFLASATVGHSTFAGSSAMSRSLQNRSRQSSHVSGFSSALMSASTQPIRNTGIGRIFATTTTNPDIQSHATSISSKQGYMLPPTKADPLLLHDEKLSRVPSNIPVPRSRELHVEEFNYNREAKRNKGVIRQPPERHVLVEPSTEYFGDNDDTDTKETDTVSPNDSISALSEADLSFTNNLEAKRHALDEAIANEDWDLAALLSDSLRATAAHPQPKKREWTQTELDRYISSNDWDAVANYIARVRSGAGKGNGEKAGKTKPQAAAGAQKRFGAKSQLQHKNLTARGESWSASESSFDSDFSSTSSDTYEEIMKARKQKDKFAC
jgi:WW domain